MSDRRQVNIDQDRATVLLLINALLIKKAHSIYVNVLSNRQAIQLMPPQNRQAVLEQYNNINRRLQCNLSVLSYINDLYHNKAAAHQPNRLQFPVILSTPPEMPELRVLYKRLQDLYPEAIEFLKHKIQQMKLLQQDPKKPPQQFPNRPAPVPIPSQTRPMDSVNEKDPMVAQSGFNQRPMMQNQMQQFSQYNVTQTLTPPQFQSPQTNMNRPMDMKTPHPGEFNDMHIANGILPQMVSKEPDMQAFVDPSTFMGDLPSKSINPMSISPQQILQGQATTDLPIDFL